MASRSYGNTARWSTDATKENSAPSVSVENPLTHVLYVVAVENGWAFSLRYIDENRVTEGSCYTNQDSLEYNVVAALIHAISTVENKEKCLYLIVANFQLRNVIDKYVKDFRAGNGGYPKNSNWFRYNSLIRPHNVIYKYGEDAYVKTLVETTIARRHKIKVVDLPNKKETDFQF